jgi:hypothetical protein
VVSEARIVAQSRPLSNARRGGLVRKKRKFFDAAFQNFDEEKKRRKKASENRLTAFLLLRSFSARRQALFSADLLRERATRPFRAATTPPSSRSSRRRAKEVKSSKELCPSSKPSSLARSLARSENHGSGLQGLPRPQDVLPDA